MAEAAGAGATRVCGFPFSEIIQIPNLAEFENKTAIVTGAASGIGLALAKELIARGARVWLTDTNEEAVSLAASSLGSDAHSAFLDVRDAESVAQLVAKVADDQGVLDFMFNNAGIGIGGEMHELGVEHFDRIVDVNIRGVTNGIAAAYPLMVAQGHGCIANTASATGLLPLPLLTPYTMTKSAVIGLSKALRIEADHYGVQVSVLCPTAVDTPMLDSGVPTDLSEPWRPDIRGYLSKLVPPIPVDQFATYAIDAVASDRATIIAPFQARFFVLLNRFFPVWCHVLLLKSTVKSCKIVPQPKQTAAVPVQSNKADVIGESASPSFLDPPYFSACFFASQP